MSAEVASQYAKNRYVNDPKYREAKKRRALARYYRLKKERLKQKAA